MSVAVASVAFVVGAVVSLATSWLLVSRLERVGERLGFSEALLGVVAALAADAPEITASFSALAHHQRAIGAGVVLGSNVFNLAALLGLGAIVAGRIELHRKVVLLGGAVALWVALVTVLAVAGVLDAPVALVAVLVVLVAYLVLLGRRRERLLGRLPSRWGAWLASAVDEEELELLDAIRPPRGRRIDVVVAGAALVVVVVASVAMERGASTLGQHFGVADIVVGALVLAAVTSLPNAVAAVHLARRGRGAASLSTALNSNNVNVLGGLLLPATILGLSHASGQSLLVAGWYAGLTVLLLALAYAGHGLSRRAGWAVVAGYAAFVVALLAVA